jgi:hypothetical protein
MSAPRWFELLVPILVRPCEGFVLTVQSRFGAQLGALQSLQHGNYTGSVTATLGYIWHYPELSTDDRGLGGGIAWAWDPALCPTILPYFHEDLFFSGLVRCQDLQAAMHRAFASWSANHRALSFIDVSDECARLHGGRVTSNCSLAEVWVTARDPATGTGLEAATALPRVVLNSAGFRFTNGESARTWHHTLQRFVPHPVVEIDGGVIAFGGPHNVAPDLCWYLDRYRREDSKPGLFGGC